LRGFTGRSGAITPVPGIDITVDHFIILDGCADLSRHAHFERVNWSVDCSDVGRRQAREDEIALAGDLHRECI